MRENRYDCFSHTNVLSYVKEEKRKFKDVCDWIFDRDTIIKHYITDSKSPEDPQGNIINVTVEHYFEVGSDQNRLHAHALLKIEHTGRLSLEANGIRAFAKGALGYNVYLSCPVSSDPVGAYENYIKKMSTERVINL